MPHPLLDGEPGSVHLLLGNEAIVRGALEAGVRVVTCYPGTPSSEVPDTFFALSPEGDYSFEYSVNEKVALEVAGGATLAGAPTLCTMKHVGVNVAADPLMTLAYVGAPGGLVLLSADDPGCHSSQNEQDNRYYARLAGMACFEPSTAQECKDMTREALLFSRKHQTPVLLRTTTRVNHLRGPVCFGPRPGAARAEGFSKDPARFVPIPAYARPMHVRLMERMKVLAGEASTSALNLVHGAGEVGVVASGVSRAYLADALAELNLFGKVRVLELGFTHPLPEALLLEFLSSVRAVLVLEELEPLLENDLRTLLHRKSLGTKLLGKEELGLPRNGEYDTRMVQGALRLALGIGPAKVEACAPQTGLPGRPPNLCAGCPHRATYYTARSVFGDEAVYSSDIGCYTLGILPPLRAADLLFCMGSSVSAGSGVSMASGQKAVAFIGDSTFFHSGVTGLINAVYNRHDLLLVILDNQTTAMTGHQPHPGMRTSALGQCPCPVDIETVVRGCGVEHVRKVNPLNFKKTKAAFEELAAASGVRVLISEEPCPLYARRVLGTKKPMAAEVVGDCEDCGKCLDELACPAFSRDGRKVRIDELACAGCMFCLQLCDNIKARKRSAR